MFNERWRDGRKEVRKYVPRLRKQRISLAAIYPPQPHLIGVGVRDKDARRKQLCCCLCDGIIARWLSLIKSLTCRPERARPSSSSLVSSQPGSREPAKETLCT
jgi:hypothetical protein